MAMKWVAKIPLPVATPAVAIQIARVRPSVARARRSRFIAVRLARKQTIPASTTRRRSCSPDRQLKTRNMKPTLLIQSWITPVRHSSRLNETVIILLALRVCKSVLEVDAHLGKSGQLRFCEKIQPTCESYLSRRPRVADVEATFAPPCDKIGFGSHGRSVSRRERDWFLSDSRRKGQLKAALKSQTLRVRWCAGLAIMV